MRWDDADGVKSTTLSYLGLDGAGSSHTFPGIFIDSPDNSHYIGVQRNAPAGAFVFADYYVGFIWEVCVWSGYRTPAPIPNETNCGPNQATTSPEGLCLNNCEWDQFYDSDT